MNPLLDLKKQGQSVWLDYIRRSFLTGGGFQRLIEEDGIRGVTSNPVIFEKAIDGSRDYDDALGSLVAKTPGTDSRRLYEALAIEDVQTAADLLRPAYDLSDGSDGFVPRTSAAIDQRHCVYRCRGPPAMACGRSAQLDGQGGGDAGRGTRR